MRKRINNFLNALIGISVGTLVGHSVYIIYDYKAHPGLYAMQSAPWYTGFDNNIAANAYGMHWGKYVSFKF